MDLPEESPPHPVVRGAETLAHPTPREDRLGGRGRAALLGRRRADVPRGFAVEGGQTEFDTGN